MKCKTSSGTRYIRFFTKKDAQAVSLWQYPAPYDVYNSAGTDDERRNMVSSRLYFAVSSTFGGEIEGYITLGPDATIKRPDLSDIYADESKTDIAIGLRPDLIGRKIGLGKALMESAIFLCEQYFPGDGFRVSVAENNTRARHIYEGLGFAKKCAFEAEIVYNVKSARRTQRTQIIVMERS